MTDAKTDTVDPLKELIGRKPKIKPLVWTPVESWKRCSKERAEAFGGEYQIVMLDPDDSPQLPSLYFEIGLGAFMFRFEQAQDPMGFPGDTCPKKFPTIESAKAAAQADYEARILSALEPQPQIAAALIEAHKAMTELQRDMLERSRAGIDAIYGEEYRIVNAGRTAWHDFCATLSRIDAIMNPGGGALKGD